MPALWHQINKQPGTNHTNLADYIIEKKGQLILVSDASLNSNNAALFPGQYGQIQANYGQVAVHHPAHNAMLFLANQKDTVYSQLLPSSSNISKQQH